MAPIVTRTPSTPLVPTSTSVPVAATPVTPTLTAPVPPVIDSKVWTAPYLPETFKDSLEFPEAFTMVNKPETADLQLDVLPQDSAVVFQSTWVYNLVAPFPSLVDDVAFKDLKNYWDTGTSSVFNQQPIWMTEDTRQILEKTWGAAADGVIKTTEAEQLLDEVWAAPQPAWAIVPFEALEPRWKVIRVDEQTPLNRDFDASTYPLSIHFGMTGSVESLLTLKNESSQPVLPDSNHNPDHMTVLDLTGTTAMVRYMAQRMEEKGVLYPAEDLKDVLSSADITHVSNEVPFYTSCPPANPVRREMRFCSDPKYMQLLQALGVDVVELTGNHILDWGYDPLLFTMDLYDQAGMKYYGGGRNLAEAIKPLLLEDHGNKIGLIGCSPAGPEQVWATATLPGSAKCDWDYIGKQILEMKADGYLPIFTFQHIEVDDFKPHSSQRVDFQKMSDLGAVIVSGSQSHFAQAMTFKNGHFIHYGLGNTLFDQMEEFHRPAFIDRHILYEGRHISTELVTMILEDYARPRLMTPDERKTFLQTIFDASVWNNK